MQRPQMQKSPGMPGLSVQPDQARLVRRKLLEDLDVRSLFALGAGDHVKRNLLVLLKGFESAPLDCGMMCKHVLTTTVRADEAETFRIIEPLYCTCTHLLS
jgi:hypothetical protein